MGRRFDSTEVAIKLSSVFKPGMILSSSLLREISVNAGIPRATLFWKYFISSTMLRRISFNRYEILGFKDDDCMKKCLERTYSKYYFEQKKYEPKKKPKKVDIDDPIVQAIGLLQDTRICSP